MNRYESGPNREQLPVPEHLDQETIVFLLEKLGHIALDFGLEPWQAQGQQLDPESPESVGQFIENIKQEVIKSQMDLAEKRGALSMLELITDEFRKLLPGGKSVND